MFWSELQVGTVAIDLRLAFGLGVVAAFRDRSARTEAEQRTGR